MTTKTKTLHRLTYSGRTKVIIILSSLILLLNLIGPFGVTKANFGQDLLAGIGCNDTNKDGTTTLDECASKKDSGAVTSFTNFKGDLTPPDSTGYAAGLTQAKDARTFILNVTNFALGFLGLLAVLVVIYGGVLSVTSAGNPDGANKGKKAITYAVIGLLVVMSSFALVNTVLLAPGGTENSSGSGKGINATTIRGVASNQRFNYLAERIDGVIIKIYNSYQFNLLMKQQLDNAYTTISSFNAGDLCSIPYSLCASQIDALVNSQLNLFTASLTDSAANTQYKTGMADLIQKIVAVQTPGIISISKTSVSKNCEKLNSGIQINPCTTTNESELKEQSNKVKDDIAAIIKASGYTFLQDAYDQDLIEAKVDIGEVYGTVSGISAAEIGKKYFNDLIPLKVSTKGVYQYSIQSAGSESLSKINQEIVKTSTLLAPAISLTSIDQTLIKEILTDLVQIKSILLNIKFVNTVISADAVTGNAPLIVDFSTVGSTDPSGLSVADKNIHWDLDGNGKFDEDSVSGSNFRNCKEKDTTSKSRVVANCTYTQPGTYRVSVKIDPSTGSINPATGLDWAQEIAPGISYIDILVNPASTKINLTAGGKPVTTYDDATGLIKEDHSDVYFTLSAAKNGIEFDATKSKFSDGTTPVANDPSAKVRWNFGVPSPNNDVFEIAGSGPLKKTQSYPEIGNYQVKFEVTNKNGIVDRKLFTVVVSNMAPEITNPPSKSKIGEELTFDGSNSTTDGEPLKFNWIIEKLESPGTAYIPGKLYAFANLRAHALTGTPTGDASGLKPKLPETIKAITLTESDRKISNKFYDCEMPIGKDDTLKCIFKKAGDYRITLSLPDTKTPTSPHNFPTTISITSNPPTAGFNYKNIGKTSPSIYSLNATQLSFDGDEIGTSNQNLEYSWEINPSTCTYVGSGNSTSEDDLVKAATDATSSQISCDKLKEYSSENSKPVVKFNEKGDYTVNLVVRSYDEKTSISQADEQIITVDNILDINWGNMKPSAILKVSGAVDPALAPSADPLPVSTNVLPVAPITFLFTSSQAVSYDIDFGDGLSDSGEMVQGVEKSIIHNYTTTGKFNAELSVFDADDVENRISRNIFIGDSKTPVSIITTRVNDSVVQPATVEVSEGKSLKNVIVINRKDNLIFDAEKSINTDGTTRRLVYAWNIDNGAKQSTTKTVSYKFDNVSEKGIPYVVKLKTSNEKDPTQNGEDSVNIFVVGSAPTLRSLTAIPDGVDLITPVSVKLAAIGAEDVDGQISQYKWWYYDAKSPATPDNRLGLQITTTPVANMTIGTKGLEGEKPSYKFGVELTDNDNLTVSTDNQNPDFKLNIIAPVVQITNGPNKAPIAKFSVDRTSVQVGESVNFTSASIDPDQGGGIKEYRWDFGDGSKGENISSVGHIYKKANVEGYKARLTVVDTNSSEATSDSIRIYVDAVAQPPVAAFTTKQTPGSKTVAFTNTTTVDTDAGAKAKKFTWDFDVTVDSNGDGKKDNDSDSTEPSPSYNYPQFGIFRSKLTVEDDQGQTNSITNFVNVKPAETPKVPPTAGATGSSSDNIASKPDTTGSFSSASKTMGANFFEASNKVDPGLLLASIAAYAILLIISFRVQKKDN